MEKLNCLLWSRLFLPLFLLCGLILGLRCRFLPLRNSPRALGMVFKKQEDSGPVTQFQAVCTALASTVGTGNIIGTAQAIAMGGPGAVFWLWVSAVPAMIIKYAEIFLGLRFRRKVSGEYQGGAMYYIEYGLGRRFRPLAVMYALFAALSVLCMGTMAQIGGAVGALEQAAQNFGLSIPGRKILRLLLAVSLSLLLYRVLSRGAKGVGRASALLVPIMSVVYIVFTLVIIICHAQRLPNLLRDIVGKAFSLRAVAGAAGGLTIKHALHWGVRRGAFSNEAGLGYAAMAHASTGGKPAQQGLWGVFEVFADTLVICTLTALAILVSGVDIPWGELVGAGLLQSAAATVFGGGLSALFLALSLFLFGFSTVLGSSLYGLYCARYLFGPGADRAYRLLLCGCAVLGCLMTTSAVWTVADAVNALMSLPNFAALLGLSALIGRECREYFGVNKITKKY